MDLTQFIRDIPDFPSPGILFRDITPLLADAEAFAEAIRAMSEPFANQDIHYVAAIEARGFIFGSPIANALNAGFIPLRKKGKLPHQTVKVSYGLEYGQDTIEMHIDAIQPGDRVLLVDDLLATGGTMVAACGLMEQREAQICGLSFLIELKALAGRGKLKNYPLHTVIEY